MAVHGHTPHLDEHADDWHHHGEAEGVPQSEHAGVVSTATILKAFVIIAVTVVAVIVAIVMYYNQYMTSFKASRIETDTLAATVRSQKSAWNNQLSNFGPAGDKPGVYAVPIDTAIDTVVKRYNAAKPGATAPQPTPSSALPTPTPAPAK